MRGLFDIRAHYAAKRWWLHVWLSCINSDLMRPPRPRSRFSDENNLRSPTLFYWSEQLQVSTNWKGLSQILKTPNPIPFLVGVNALEQGGPWGRLIHASILYWILSMVNWFNLWAWTLHKCNYISATSFLCSKVWQLLVAINFNFKRYGGLRSQKSISLLFIY